MSFSIASLIVSLGIWTPSLTLIGPSLTHGSSLAQRESDTPRRARMLGVPRSRPRLPTAMLERLSRRQSMRLPVSGARFSAHAIPPRSRSTWTAPAGCSPRRRRVLRGPRYQRASIPLGFVPAWLRSIRVPWCDIPHEHAEEGSVLGDREKAVVVVPDGAMGSQVVAT
jgi:hypothetical protein